MALSPLTRGTSDSFFRDAFREADDVSGAPLPHPACTESPAAFCFILFYLFATATALGLYSRARITTT
jgi:hypothetical protein